ncbi:hypothetical protein ACHQM5_018244 [Ranunculus cassubicifolius]
MDVKGKRKMTEDVELNEKKKARLEEEEEKEYGLSIPRESCYKTPQSQCSNLNRQVLTAEIIFYEILPWLPLESLFRFKLVCKEWNKAISSDTVLRARQCRKSMHHPPGLLYQRLRRKTIFLDPSSRSCTVMKYMKWKGSSNGLLCCSFRNQGIKYFLVMNPVIREAVVVNRLSNFGDVTLAFEPMGCPPYFALVRWHVINVENDINGENIHTVGFTLYTSVARTWSVAKAKVRIFRQYFGKGFGKSQDRSVYMGGKVYWKVVRDVFWLDIREDSAGTVAVPNMEEEDPHGDIGDLNGELSYSMISDEDIVIWVLRTSQEQKWVQKYCVSLKDIFKGISDNIPSCCKNAILWLFETPSTSRRRALPYEGGDLLFWVAHGTSSRDQGIVFSYNMNTRSLRIIHDSQMIRYGFTLFSYKRSLASVPTLSSTTTTV